MEALARYIGPQTVIFGICAVVAVAFASFALVVIFILMPNKEYVMKSADRVQWTPEMSYVAQSRFFAGIVLGMVIMGVTCVLIYAKWRMI